MIRKAAEVAALAGAVAIGCRGGMAMDVPMLMAMFVGVRGTVVRRQMNMGLGRVMLVSRIVCMRVGNRS